MSDRRVNLPNVLHRVAFVSAWAFAVATLATLLIVGWAHWPGTGTTAHVLYGGFGLEYSGVGGTVLIIVEVLVVGSAIVLSILPGRRMRLVGHALLVVWVGIWLGNAINHARVDGGFVKILLVGLLAFFFLCTVVRAGHGWRTGTSPRKAAEADVAA
jgi:hypothetical protein